MKGRSSSSKREGRALAGRARSVDEARAAVDRAAQLRDRSPAAYRDWQAAIEAFHTAIDDAYPEGFWEFVSSRDPNQLESVISFLEPDPWFFRSGYAKATVINKIMSVALSVDQVRRLRVVLLEVVRGRDRREFRAFCRLARKLASPELSRELEALESSSERGIRRRAGWMLSALRKPHPA